MTTWFCTAGRSPPRKANQRETTMFALSVEDGKTLWQTPHHPCGHMGTPDDILVAGGLVWNGAVAQGSDSGTMTGRDLHTGEVKSEFAPDVETHWFHHRCYRAKATDKYLLFSRTGIEFIDHAAEHWTCHHWVRGACHYGIMPCNGLIYAPQHPCACYIEAKLSGFTALAPPSGGQDPTPRECRTAERLARGPAYERRLLHPGRLESRRQTTGRRSGTTPQRSGAVKTTVRPTDLKRTWSTKLGGKLSTSVVADGKLFVASIDTHTRPCARCRHGRAGVELHGRRSRRLAADDLAGPRAVRIGRRPRLLPDGKRRRTRVAVSRRAGGPADDGLRADRVGVAGARQRAGPERRALLRRRPLDVPRRRAAAAAARSRRRGGSSPRRSSTTRTRTRRRTCRFTSQGLNMPVALPDILSSDGKYVYMRSLPFDLEGKRKFVSLRAGQGAAGRRPPPVLSHRLPRRFPLASDLLGLRPRLGVGRRRLPPGRSRDSRRSAARVRRRDGVRLRPALAVLPLDDAAGVPPVRRKQAAGDCRSRAPSSKPIKKDGKRVGSRKMPVTRFVPDWSDDVSVQVNSMVLTDNALFAAGPPDVEDEEESVKSLLDPETQKKLAEQSAAFEGKRGALLVAVSRDDGKKLAAYRLDFVPRFDGLIAANGRLYVSTVDGEVLCLSGATGRPLQAADDVVVASRQ